MTDAPGSDPSPRPEARGLGGEVWSQVFEVLPVPCTILELASDRLAANEAYRRLLGLPLETELHLDDARALTPTGDRAEFDRRLADLRAGRLDRLDTDRRYERQDGSIVFAHLTSQLVRDSQGRPAALLTVLHDVTERREMARALSRSEARFRALVQRAADPIVVVDGFGRVTYASPSAAALAGRDLDELDGTVVAELLHPDERLVVAQALRTVVATGREGGPLRCRVVRPDGTEREVEAVATNLLADPAVEGIVLNVRDLTGRAEAASALELGEVRFRRMLENISDTVTLVDRNGNVLASTGNVRETLGYEPAFWEHRNLFTLVHPDDHARVLHELDALLAVPGGEATGEVRVRAATGEWIDAEISAVNLLDDPDVGALVLTTRNITARKRFEEELAAARDQAVRALEMRTEFVASVSHELRTPIHGILGLTELLAAAELDADARGLVRSIGRATQALRMVLDDILDYSKIEMGRLELERVPFAPRELADDLMALFGPQASVKGVDLRVEVAGELPARLVGDVLRIRQVLTNLLGNAVKFTEQGRVDVLLESGVDGGLRAMVRDTGIGIAPEALERIFEPYSQAHRTTAREFGGTGLGLSISRRLVELMGGALEVRSTPGHGSVFSFELPLGQASGPVEERPPQPGRAAVAGARVLVVEDNAVNQLLVRRQLERLGCEEEVVATGLEALERFDELEVDLILMDWQLPELDGIETTRRWRALELERDRPRVPIVAMTASALPGDRARCLAAGMDDFLAKPVGMDTLRDAVARWAGGDARSGPVPAVVAAGDVDESVLDRLGEELDDPLLVATVVRTYLRELDGRVEAISAGAARGDFDAVRSAAHTLRSTSAAVGAVALADRCERLEQACSVAGGPGPGPSVPELRELAADARRALESRVRVFVADGPSGS